MIFNKHSDLNGLHAVLGASKYHWINYSEEKMIDSYSKQLAAQKGVELHEFAKRCIELGIKLRQNRHTLNMYVNDAIGFKMNPEQVLYYSPNCFGTADAICYRNDILRIHDYKSGESPASMNQLKIYNALFCLEYRIEPYKINKTELRIYQSNDILVESPDPDEIRSIMDKIILFDTIIEDVKIGVKEVDVNGTDEGIR